MPSPVINISLLTFLQPRSILLAKVNPETKIALTGFSLARDLGRNAPLKKEQLGRAGFVAPEVLATSDYMSKLLREEEDSKLAKIVTNFTSIVQGYDEKADSWSLGVPLFNLLTGELQHLCAAALNNYEL